MKSQIAKIKIFEPLEPCSRSSQPRSQRACRQPRVCVAIRQPHEPAPGVGQPERWVQMLVANACVKLAHGYNTPKKLFFRVLFAYLTFMTTTLQPASRAVGDDRSSSSPRSCPRPPLAVLFSLRAIPIVPRPTFYSLRPHRLEASAEVSHFFFQKDEFRRLLLLNEPGEIGELRARASG